MDWVETTACIANLVSKSLVVAEQSMACVLAESDLGPYRLLTPPIEG